MNSVVIAKLLDGKTEGYRIVTEDNVIDEKAQVIENLIRNRRIKIQNLDLIKDKNSYIGVITLGFSVGHGYPLIKVDSKERIFDENINKLTLIGYDTNQNSKVFVVSDAYANMFFVSNVEIGLLEKFDLITNASYSKNGVVKLDGGTMEQVSQKIKYKALEKDVTYVKNYIEKLLKDAEYNIKRNAKAIGEPNFGRLDALEKQVPDVEKRRESYLNMGNAYSIHQDADLSGALDIAAIVGLGIASFALDSVLFAGKLRLGNAILDSLFD